MIIQKEIRNLINELSTKYNLSFDEIKDIVYSQFKYARYEMEKGSKGDFPTFKNIVLRYLGTFHTNETRIKRITEFKQKKDARLNKEFQSNE